MAAAGEAAAGGKGVLIAAVCGLLDQGFKREVVTGSGKLSEGAAGVSGLQGADGNAEAAVLVVGDGIAGGLAAKAAAGLAGIEIAERDDRMCHD